MAIEKVEASHDTKEIGEAGSDDVNNHTPPITASAFEARLPTLPPINYHDGS
jgi:hypothetical protein